MIRVRITKLSDDAFNGKHPNGIYEGSVREGYMMNKPKVGESFVLFYRSNKLNPVFTTSNVTVKLNKKGIFKTLNSTYKLEILENESIIID